MTCFNCIYYADCAGEERCLILEEEECPEALAIAAYRED